MNQGKLFFTLIFCVLASKGSLAEEIPDKPVSPAPGLARRGIESIRKGDYEVARGMLRQSLKEAVTLAREDWVAKAVLNLADQ